MEAVNILAPDVGMLRACSALRVHRSGVYRDDARRRLLSPLAVTRLPRPAPPLALSDAERQVISKRSINHVPCLTSSDVMGVGA